MSTRTLRSIKEKIGDIQFGLLRFREKNEQMTLQVKLAENEGSFLSCLLTDAIPEKMINRDVNLIQKCHDDYLYVAGTVTDALPDSNRILSVEIKKACWFVKKSRGSTSWLQQKYIYEQSNGSEAA